MVCMFGAAVAVRAESLLGVSRLILTVLMMLCVRSLCVSDGRKLYDFKGHPYFYDS